MTMHHIIREEDLERQCPYCGLNLVDKNFTSAFFGKIHYKHVTCDCGKHFSVRITEFTGSGHDEWDKKRVRRMTIEDRIKKASVGE